MISKSPSSRSPPNRAGSPSGRTHINRDEVRGRTPRRSPATWQAPAARFAIGGVVPRPPAACLLQSVPGSWTRSTCVHRKSVARRSNPLRMVQSVSSWVAPGSRRRATTTSTGTPGGGMTEGATGGVHRPRCGEGRGGRLRGDGVPGPREEANPPRRVRAAGPQEHASRLVTRESSPAGRCDPGRDREDRCRRPFAWTQVVAEHGRLGYFGDECAWSIGAKRLGLIWTVTVPTIARCFTRIGQRATRSERAGDFGPPGDPRRVLAPQEPRDHLLLRDLPALVS